MIWFKLPDFLCLCGRPSGPALGGDNDEEVKGAGFVSGEEEGVLKGDSLDEEVSSTKATSGD